jgi:hypothetical protein
MVGPILLRLLTLALVLPALAGPALAQKEDRERTTGYSAIIDNIDLLVDRYSDFLARKYDLTEEQDEYTRVLLRERSSEFLDQNEGELRELVDRLFEVRTGGEMNAEELVQWGQRAKPIYEAARKLIVDGNDEWREILTDDQKKTHDEDLKLMYQSFETTEDQLQRIVSGEMTVEEFRSPQRSRRRSTPPKPAAEAPGPDEPVAARDADPNQPQPQPRSTPRTTRAVRPPPRPATGESTARITRPEHQRPSPGEAQPGTGRASRVSRPRGTERGPTAVTRVPSKAGAVESESAWDKYVREFIAKYQLNDEQSQKANAVLEDCKAQADRYMRGRKTQIEKIDKQVETLKGSKDKNKAKNLSELTAQRKKIMEPIDRIFEQQLKPRLERLPTRAQRRVAEAAAKRPAAKSPAVRSPKEAEQKKEEPKQEEQKEEEKKPAEPVEE